MQLFHSTTHLPRSSQFASPFFSTQKLSRKLCFVSSKFFKRHRLLLTILFSLLVVGCYFSATFNPAPTNFDDYSTQSRKRTENSFSSIYISDAARRQPLNSSVFLWIMTAPRFHRNRVQAVNATWLHRFPHAAVFTSQQMEDDRIPHRVAFEGFDDSYEKIFHKTKFGFYYAYMGVSQKFDWYIRADDNTYVLPENLNAFLATLNSNKPIYAGYKWTHKMKAGHNSGSFYILSRAAMKIFAERLYHDEQACPFDELEDVGIARCLASAGIYPIETRNSKGQERFQPADALHAYVKNNVNSFDVFPTDLISIHYMEPKDMLTADLFYYHIRRK